MPDNNSSQQGGTGSLLDNFSFDNDEFFGVKNDENKSDMQTLVNNVKSNSQDDDDEDDGSLTPIDEKDKKGAGLNEPHKKASKEEDEEEPFSDKKETKAEDKKDENKGSGKKKSKNDDEDDSEEPEVEWSFGKEPKSKEEQEKIKAQARQNATKGDEHTSKEDFYTGLALDLQETGVFQHIEVPKDKKLTEDDFFDLQAEEVELRTQESIQAFAEKLGKDGQDFIKFIQSGGKTTQFLQNYVINSFDLEELDETDPKQVDKVLNHYLDQYEELDEDDKADRIKWLKEGGKDKSQAKKWFKAIKAEETERKETLLKSQEETELKRQKSIEKFQARVAKVIKEKESVGVFPISKDDKTGLADYINKPTIKIGKGQHAPAFQVALAKVLRAETDEDIAKLVLLGKLFKSDFNVTDLVKEVKTETTKRVRRNLQEGRNGLNIHNSGSSGISKQLSDFFD